MDRVSIVRSERANGCVGDGPTTPSWEGGESPSILQYLSDEQIAALGVFYFFHDHCSDVELAPHWSGDLEVVDLLTVDCHDCGITRTFNRAGRR